MLFNLLNLIKNKKRERALAVSVIGSGGKTTLLRTLGKQAEENGFRTVLTTTTHMLYPFSPFVNFDDKINKTKAKERLNSYLNQCGTLVSADDKGCLEYNLLHPYSDSKLSTASEKNINLFLETADLVISEADGSKRLPMKARNAAEPVLLPNSDLVILVFGLSSLGKPLSEVCHRYEIAMELLGIDENEIVNEEIVAELLTRSYLKEFENEKIAILINQADTEDFVKRAKKIIKLLDSDYYEIIGNNPLRVRL